MESANENKQQPKAQVENYANDPLDQKRDNPAAISKSEKMKERNKEREIKEVRWGNRKQAAKNGDIKVLD